MFSLHQEESWGPSHQHIPSPIPRRRHPFLKAGLGLLVLFELASWRASHSTAGDRFGWALKVLLLAAIATGAGWMTIGVLTRRAHGRPRTGSRPATLSDAYLSEGQRLRARSRARGGGAFLGLTQMGNWVTADPEHAVLILGPPRSGKTTSVVIPTMLCAPSVAVCTSTKTDVLEATWRSRAETGQVWLFDPAGEEQDLPHGLRRLAWSPIAAATSWDRALLMARAMSHARPPAKGASNESHWAERSAALLAPLLHAASLADLTMQDLLRWVLRSELEPAGRILRDHNANLADDVLAGIAGTDERERSSIFSATAGILSAYNTDAARRSANDPNFDPERFAASSDTLYITAPAHQQELSAPLIVGLLEQIRWAVYRRARQKPTGPPMIWCLDEVANIAPIHDLPALVSEAGGQHLHVLACLQDLSQARTRWGQAAEGFLSLFQTKLILSGVADTKTLEAISLVLGEYDRHTASETLSYSQKQRILIPEHPTHSETVNYTTQRQRVLTPGDIARLPAGQALHLKGTRWGLVRLAPQMPGQGKDARRRAARRGRSREQSATPRPHCRPQ